MSRCATQLTWKRLLPKQRSGFPTFGFTDDCITIEEIQGVAIISKSNDGWNIDSIVTLVSDSSGGVQVLTHDLDLDRWIDGNGPSSQQRFNLTFAEE